MITCIVQMPYVGKQWLVCSIDSSNLCLVLLTAPIYAVIEWILVLCSVNPTTPPPLPEASMATKVPISSEDVGETDSAVPLASSPAPQAVPRTCYLSGMAIRCDLLSTHVVMLEDPNRQGSRAVALSVSSEIHAVGEPRKDSVNCVMAVAALECRIDHELDDKLDMNVARSACLIEPLEFKLAYSASDQVGSTDVVANLDVAMSTSEVEMHLSPTDVAMLLQIVSGLTAIGPAWSTAATTDKSRNLALWCPCVASSERDEGHRAAFATNPQPGTRWVADFAQVKQRNDAKWEQWIYVDLLEVCSVESVRITFDGSAFAADFDVQLSRHSPTLHRWRSTESRRSHKGSFAEVRITSLATSARYVRVLLKRRGHLANGYSIVNLEVWGTGTAEDVGRGASATASSVSKATGSALHASLAIDRNPLTCWAADLSTLGDHSNRRWEQWLRLDLIDPVRVDLVRVKFSPTDYASCFIVQASHDRKIWIDLAVIDGYESSDSMLVISVPAEKQAEYRYVQLLLRERANSTSGYAVSAFEVLHAAAPPSNMTTIRTISRAVSERTVGVNDDMFGTVGQRGEIKTAFPPRAKLNGRSQLALWRPCCASSHVHDTRTFKWLGSAKVSSAHFVTDPHSLLAWTADFSSIPSADVLDWEQWLYVDLLEVCAIESVWIEFDVHAFASDFDIQISSNVEDVSSHTHRSWRSIANRKLASPPHDFVECAFQDLLRSR